MMEEVATTYYHSPIGLMRICGTDKFLTQVYFVDDPGEIMPMQVNPLLQTCTEQLIEYFNGQRRVFDLPVNQPGTAFQQKVWSRLNEIPFGKTISYLQLAKNLGDPKVIRAAAATNGKNQLCVIIPCHRVIGSNQSLVGYAGGLWRKKWLLQHENKIAHGVQTLF